MDRQQVSKTDSRPKEVFHPDRPGPSTRASLHPLHQLRGARGNRAFGRCIQAKLSISQPGDAYEQEADRVADQVMRMPDPETRLPGGVESDSEYLPSVTGRRENCAAMKGIENEDEPFKISTIENPSAPLNIEEGEAEGEPPKAEVAEKCCQEDNHDNENPVVQLSCDPRPDAPKLEPEIEGGIHAMRGQGTPLSSSERQFMEPRFGVDFGAIRLHTSHEADTHNRALQARAFTLGNDIFFRAGEYTSGEAESNRLLAHELTHTIQQAASSSLNNAHVRAQPAAARLIQRQPIAPAPAPAVAAAPVGRATVNFLPTIQDLAPAGWGVTTEDDAIIDITAFASAASWKCVITTADQQAHQGVRLLPGVVEVTAGSVAAEASCATLQTMSTSLNSVANQGAHSGFYMLSAVQAHENLHITQYRGDLAPHYATLKAAVEALTVPLASHAGAAAAKTAIKALPAFTAAMSTFLAGDVAANNKTAAHTLAASFNVAEHGVVDPMIATIAARRTALKCPP